MYLIYICTFDFYILILSQIKYTKKSHKLYIYRK